MIRKMAMVGILMFVLTSMVMLQTCTIQERRSKAARSWLSGPDRLVLNSVQRSVSVSRG